MNLKFKVELPDDLSDSETQALREAILDDFSPNGLANWLKEHWLRGSRDHLVARLQETDK